MANPLSKAKDLYKMQQEAREMQKRMKAVSVEGESKDSNVTVQINGVNEIVEIEIEDSLIDLGKKNLLIRGVKEAYKDATKKLQKQLMKDMDLEQMKSMLGM